MTLRDPNDYMSEIISRFRQYENPKLRVYVEYYDDYGYLPAGIWEDAQLLYMRMNTHIAMGEHPDEIEL